MKFQTRAIVSFILIMPVLFLMACNSKDDKQAKDGKDSTTIGSKGDDPSENKGIVGKWEYVKMTYDNPPESESDIQRRKDDHEENTGLIFDFNNDNTYAGWKNRDGEMKSLAKGTYQLAGDVVIVSGTVTNGSFYTDTTDIVSIEKSQIILHPTHSRIKLYFKRVP